MSNRKGLKIFPKVLLSFLIVPLIPIGGLYYSTYNASQDNERAINQGFVSTAALVASKVDDWTDKNVRLSKYIANLSDIQSMDPLRQKDILETAKESTEWMTVIFTIDTDGNAVTRSDDKSLKNYSDRSYFKQVMGGAPIGQQVLIGKSFPVPLHCFAIPIRSANRIVGVLTQCSNLEDISSNVTSIKVGDTGFAFLVDNTNKLIAHGSELEDLKIELQDFSNNPALAANKENALFDFSENQIDRIGFRRNAGLDWTLVIQQDKDEAHARLIASKKTAIILLVITLVFTAIMAVFLSRGLTRPIKELTDAATEFSKGKLRTLIPGTDRSDELGDLASALTRMSESIKIAIRRLSQKKT